MLNYQRVIVTNKSNLGASLFFLCQYVLETFGLLCFLWLLVVSHWKWITELLGRFFLDTFTLLLFDDLASFLVSLFYLRIVPSAGLIEAPPLHDCMTA